MNDWPIEAWVGLATLFLAIAGGTAAAYFQSRKPEDSSAEADYKPRPLKVVLDEAQLDRILSRADRIEDALDDHGRKVDRHGDAIGEQTDTLKRKS